MARLEGLADEPEILSGGPRERFSSPRWFVFRVVALGLIALSLAAFAGDRWGTTHPGSPRAVAPGDVREVIAIPDGHPSGEGFGAGSIWVPVWSLDGTTSHGDGYVARYDPATSRMLTKIQVGSQPLAAQPGSVLCG